MRKLPVFMIGLVFIVASCAPYAATIPPTQTPTPTATPTQTFEPTVTTENQTLSAEEEAIAPSPGARNFQPQLEEVSIDLDEVVTLLPPDAIPAVLPQRAQDIMVSAVQADSSGIDPSVQVIGLEINGESRAYPISFLSAHEIVNDTLGGRHIAVTW